MGQQKKITIENKTGIPELDAIIAATSKKFEKDLSGANWGDIEPISTTSMVLDIALKVGGIPRGRITEVYGEEGSLKTSLCLVILAEMQRIRREQGISTKRDLIIDLEHSMTTSFIEGFGVDLDQVIWERPDNVEEALQLAIDYPKSGHIDCVVFDSIDAGQNLKQLSRNVGENDVGGTSKDMNFAIRQISKLGPKTGTTFLFINQIKMNPGVMMGNPQTTSGGRAMQYYASLRIKTKKRQKCSTLPNSTKMRIVITKTKMSGDIEGDIECIFTYGKGFNEVFDVEMLAKELDMLSHSNGQTKVKWSADAEKEPLLPDIEKGKQAALEALASNDWLRMRLKHAVMRAYRMPSAMSDEDILALKPAEPEPEVVAEEQVAEQ